ncbi:MAG: hypothetical protein ABGZ17_29345 [Planctomycetaceae bacterium]
MATTIPDLQSTSDSNPVDVDDERPAVDAMVLEDKLPTWFRCRPLTLVLTLFVSLVFLICNFLPLAHTDLWGHMAYGRMIAENRSLPTTEPLMTMAVGVRFIDSAWLSQLIGYATYQAAGPVAIKFLYATMIATCLVLLLRAVYLRSGDWGWPLIAASLFLLANWQHLLVVRPQLAGLLCFMIVFYCVAAAIKSRVVWVVIPGTLMLWCNLHGSFVVGLLLLGGGCVGRFADMCLRTGSLTVACRDQRLRKLFLLTELAVIGTLLNPYGLGMYAEVLAFAGYENLQNLVEWDPLTLRMWQGRAAAAVALLLVCAYRNSPRRVSVVELCWLLGFGGWALWTSRMLVWWTPVAAYYVALHGNAAWKQSATYRKWTGLSRSEVHDRRWDRDYFHNASLWTVASLGLVAFALTITPLVVQLKTGKRADFDKMVSDRTPVAAVERLNQMDQRPQGVLFNAYDWGDYLLWAGHDLEVFVASHAHLVPREVWRHYMAISSGESNSDELLARYGVNTMLVDKDRSQRLVSMIRRNSNWKEVYSDELAVIFVRKEPI